MMKSNLIKVILYCVFLIGKAYSSGFGVATQIDHGQDTKDVTTSSLLENKKVSKNPFFSFERIGLKHSQKTERNKNILNDEAFSKTVQNMMPMTPNQIKTLRYMLSNSQKAAAAYPGVPPRPTSSSLLVNQSPGATPPIIRLRSGFVTSLVFLDSTGSSWPISAYDLGDPNAFNIQWNRKGNILLVQANSTYKSGNLAVILKSNNSPVMLTLMPGQSNVDYRVDLRVPGLGPNAKPNMESLPEKSSPELINFLDGVAPKGAHAVMISGGENQSQAWLFDNNLYIRTLATVLSPGWIASMSSPDGTHVYELPQTPVILASEEGNVIQLTIKGL